MVPPTSHVILPSMLRLVRQVTSEVFCCVKCAAECTSARSQGLGSIMSGPVSHQTRQFSPYRHAPTQDDLLHAVVRGRAVAIPEANGHITEPSVHANGKQPSVASRSKAPTVLSAAKPAATHSQLPTRAEADADITPTPSRPHSPVELNQEEQRIVHDTLASRTPRTSYYAGSTLEPDVSNSRFHDMDLCILLHQENDPTVHEVVKKALRKAIHQRMKKLGMKYDPQVRHVRTCELGFRSIEGLVD
jgi:hypothetical protein